MTRIYLSSPDVGDDERTAILRAFDSGWVAPVGPEIDAFETEIGDLVGAQAVALSSGTAALHLALLAAGVEPGDRVVCSTFTFAASANAIAYCGATPVFVDSDATSWNLSAPLLAELLADTARAGGAMPRAAVVVDLYGQCADHDAIRSVCDEYGVAVIEDAAEALGATYRGRPAGSLADVAALSFNGNKIITTSGGGMLLARDPAVAQRARYLATQARQPTVHYEHTDIGFNYRMSNLLAALGRAQLARLPGMIDRRLAINAGYRAALGDRVEFMPVPEWSRWNGWLTCALLDDREARDRMIQTLAAADIEARPLWKPLHLQPVFAGAPSHVDGTSERLFDRGVCLPSGSVLDDADIDRVVEVATRVLSG